MPKPHLVSSPEPLTKEFAECRDMDSACGKTIKRATVVFMWDNMDVNQAFDREAQAQPNTCHKCLTSDNLRGRYVYGIISGVEARVEQ